MPSPAATRNVTVQHEQGLHARPAELVARAAMRFASRIEIVRDGLKVDAKSILNILTLGAMQGVELRIEAVGDDAEDAVESLARVIEGDFGADGSPDEGIDDTTAAAPGAAPNESTTQGQAG